ncbi:MAG TPA: DUF4363 family protein [Clostridiaceae bacterium]
MKRAIATGIIFFSMLIILIFSLSYLNDSCKELSKINNALRNQVEKENWKGSAQLLEDFSRSWEKRSIIITVFVHHQELDVLSEEIVRTKTYIKEQEKVDALAAISTVDFQLKHIIDLEKVNIQNIF